MRRKVLLVITIAILLFGVRVAVKSLSGSQVTPVQSHDPDPPVASGSELIEGYRQWTRVNPIPAVFPSKIAIQCAMPTAAQLSMEQGNPHRDKFIAVYVNDTGRQPMMQQKFPRFPQGSVIVKEKLASKDDTQPELLTVMMKRERGFNPENGDWEYMVVDGSGKSVQARGKLEKCQACHTMASDKDYVNRNYLPYEVWKKLK